MHPPQLGHEIRDIENALRYGTFIAKDVSQSRQTLEHPDTGETTNLYDALVTAE